MKNLTVPRTYLYLVVGLALVGATLLAMRDTWAHCSILGCEGELAEVAIFADPIVIQSGQSSLLTWQSSNVTNCRASDGWSGPKSTQGSEPVRPSVTTRYKITCDSTLDYEIMFDYVEVTVLGGGTPPPPPPILPPPGVPGGGGSGPSGPMVTISSNPPTIYRGETSMLRWSSSNATKCQATGSWTGTKPTSGEEKVSPSATTLYGIVCTNDVGTGAAQTMVTVLTPGVGAPKPEVKGEAVIAPLYVACVVNPENAAIGKQVTFVAGRSGGVGPITYVWTGDVAGIGQTVSKVFSTAGTKRATLFARDARGTVAKAECSATIYKPTKAVPKPAPKPKPAPQPAPECKCPPTTTPPVATPTPACRTYTVCDGATYIPNGPANGAFQNGVPTDGTTKLVYDPTTNQWQLVAGTSTNTANSAPQGFASLFVTANGNPSRFTFLLIWYFLLLFAIGFAALIYSTLRRR